MVVRYETSESVLYLGGSGVAKGSKRDKSIAPSLIWLCLGCIGYLIYRNWIFLVVCVMVSGVLYVRNN